ncbi:MAG: methyltransferase domain-containing protein [Anaerolineales bacterium]|jgi:hypothetical protein
MTQDDAQKWNRRYRENARPTYTRPRKFLLEILNDLPEGGLALDAAMGLGGNAKILLARGLRVVGVDISEIGVRKANVRNPGLMAVVADLNNFYLPAEYFDVILNFYYLQRDLWARYFQALRPAGLLVVETMTLGTRAFRPDIDPIYLLQPQELRLSIAELGMDILSYREGMTNSRRGTPRTVASLLARKP